MRVLLATPYSPTCGHDHAAADLAQPLVRELARHVELFVYSPSQDAGIPGTDADGPTFLSGTAAGLGVARHWRIRPGWMRKEWSAAATAEVLAYVARLQPDVLHCEYLQAAEPILAAGHPSVVALHDFTSGVQRGLLAASGGPMRWYRQAEVIRTERFERRVLAAASVVIALSAHDQRVFGEQADTVMLAPPGVALPERRWDGPRADGVPPRLLFFGAMWRSANVEIARFLIQEVMPRVWSHRPDVYLRIAGARPGAEVYRVAAGEDRVGVIGFVDDVEREMTEASLVLAPNRVGGGVLLKMLRALAVGCPVVTSPDAAGAVGANHEEHVLIGDDPRGMAEGVLRLLGEPALARRIGAAGRTLVEDGFTWERAGATYLTAYQLAAAGT